MNICLTEHKIELKNNDEHMMIGAGALFMAGIGVWLIYSLLPFGETYTFGDVLGFVFVCLWTVAAIVMAVLSISSANAVLRIDRESVSYQSFIQKQVLTWPQIADYGLSYCGQSRGDGNTYDFYFSMEKQTKINECSKKLKGKMIKYTVQEKDYSQIVSKVIPLCRSNTRVEPFVGDDKPHFL